ncbi:MAG: adenine phosphoribosyltransferase [Candidatus Omnitrophica bacterium]|nr:adenine phosphoribosyltransferase [Candidatus Omnitrophota bacterium]
MKTDLKKFIRDVHHFPKKGIIFKDITTLLKEPEVFKEVIDTLYRRYKNKKIDVVVAVEARGFIFGGALAYKLGAGFVPVRKKGKLPHETLEVTYNLEYGTDTLTIHKDAIITGHNVLIVDDLLATGGTVGAVCDLVRKLKGRIAEVSFVIELSFLKGRERLAKYPVYSLVKY